MGGMAPALKIIRLLLPTTIGRAAVRCAKIKEIQMLRWSH
jgi:hypothetical protein